MRYLVQAQTGDEVKQKYLKIIMECLKENPVAPAEIEQMKSGKIPESEQPKCLLACAYRKSGMMDSAGKLSIDGVKQVSQRYFANNPEKLKKSEEFIEACKSVNDEAVSDGDKGCERAALIFKCTVEKAPGFDLI
uniref:Putative odorant binding protein 4 n=1 Tax=Corcyra cephalonica TaxID=139036 RepID=A0A8K1UB37_CORCP|nr:putative odorant binding protein 4 [Corcyra cephalonica]